MSTKDGRFFIRVDVGFWDHPKAVAAGRDGRDLYLAALAWTRAQLQDGKVPATMLPSLAFRVGIPFEDAQAAADRLVEVVLWERRPDGWHVHDYAVHQSTSAEIEEQRREWRDRKQRQRDRTPPPVTGDTNGTPLRIPRPETETETETETEPSSSSSGPIHQELSTGPDDEEPEAQPPTPGDDRVARAVANELGRRDSAASPWRRTPGPHAAACADARWRSDRWHLAELVRAHPSATIVELANLADHPAFAPAGLPPNTLPVERPPCWWEIDIPPNCWRDDDGEWHTGTPPDSP